MKTIHVITASYLFCACGTENVVENNDQNTPPATSARFAMTPFEVAPAGEGLKCQNFANPFGKDVDVVAWRSQLSPSGHHMITYLVDGASDVALRDCTEGQPDQIVFQGQQIGAKEMHYPSGIGLRLGKDQSLMVRVHYLNAGAAETTVENALELDIDVDQKVTRSIAPLFFDNIDLHVPAGAPPTQIVKDCIVAEDADLVMLTGHMHAHGLDFRAMIDEEMLYQTDNWHEPPLQVYDPPRAIPAGTAIRFACTYRSEPDREVVFGDSIEDDEMCGLLGSWAPRNGGAGRLLSCAPPMMMNGGACNTCLNALINGAPESACSDNGPVTSAMKLEAFQACSCGSNGPCAAACANSGCSGQRPDAECDACIAASCLSERDACFADG